MKKLLIVFSLFFGLALISCDVDQTEEGEMPEVDVSVEEGNMPEYDVDWANVDVGTRTKTVTVPKLVIVQEKEQVEVPYIDVNMPDNGESVERNIVMEVEVEGEMKRLDIQEIYATGNNLVVIARLESTGEDLQGQTVRVSDQVVLNAPEDLNVKYYIIGDRPAGDFNNQYNYINNRNDIADARADGRTIYES